MIVDSALYVDGQRREGRLALEDVPAACLRAGAFVWLGLYEPTNEEFEAVRAAFGLHELAVEDAVKAHQRPKLEAYDDSLFLVLKTARYLDAEERVEFGEILVFVGQSFIVHVRHGEAAALSGASVGRSRPATTCSGAGRARCSTPSSTMSSTTTGRSSPASRTTSARSSSRSSPTGVTTPSQRIYMLKREVLELHQASVPLEEALDALHSRKFETIHEDIREYFRDVHDHVLKVVERAATFSDLLTSILSANLTSVTVRQNEDMRKISAWVAIAAVPTMLAGIYGMNFEHMPELGWVAGYPLALGTMGAACGLLYRLFRRSGWL